MNWYKIAQVKKMIIMRGLSGSGKSTLARELGEGGVILSTDDFWEQDGEYNFDVSRIQEAHDWNRQRAEGAVNKGISPVVIDNTNVEAWEAKEYVKMAKDQGYDIEIREADTPWAFNAEELAKKNTHGVDQETIQKMLDVWEPNITVEDIERSEKPDFELPQKIYDDIAFDDNVNKEMKQKFPEYNLDPTQGDGAAKFLAEKAKEKYPDADWDGIYEKMIKKFHAGIT